MIGQVLMDYAKLTPGHTLSILVVAGAVLDGFGLYEPLIDFAGGGATIPITSFGNSLQQKNMMTLARRKSWVYMQSITIL